MDTDNKILTLLQQFELPGEVMGAEAFGNGHINDTFKVTVKTRCGDDAQAENRRFVLQKLNKSIFPKPEDVMHNMVLVTQHLQKKAEAERAKGCAAETTVRDNQLLYVIPTKSGSTGVYDEDGEFWRMLSFIEDAICYETAEDPQLFYESGVAFGHFQQQLSDFDASLLKEVLPGFHDTRRRLADFKRAVSRNTVDRLENVREDTDWLLDHESIANVLMGRLDDGRLPLRVTHNDTKLNNIMMDPVTRKGVCVIDLDTVMPGLSATDFGDSIRFGASTGTEDEKDVSKVSLNLELYHLYRKGFLEGCGGALTEEEEAMLPWGALVITYEQALRFLGDYLDGDTYYKVDYPEHNLVRARTQIALAKDMLLKFDQMK